MASVFNTAPLDATGDSSVIIRDAIEDDMPEIQSIYAYEVYHGLATFELSPPTVGEMCARRKNVLAMGLPYLTAELDGKVVGYCYAATYRPRLAYRFTIEDSVYVAKDMFRKKIGSQLLSELLSRCVNGPWRQMIAVIGDSANAGSIALHKSMGFKMIGTHNNVGFKLGRWVDTVMMQRELGMGGGTLPDKDEWM